MTNRIPYLAAAYAINEERQRWTPANSGTEARAHLTEALDRLAHSMARQLQPDAHAAFMERSGTIKRRD